ncbi:unnamed protein product [Didymodactylos carnosus]|uniref:Uncharacterized protein n=1 Tax=Didymodactylos carnosus TaxID=1234261 RepID=A0A815LYZ4_9BILA|nr:unnamed protein product [Didymodactylos carnosus]CAF4302459.1 unnamed protein product [Didymodactylos carnosus]
MARGAQTTLEQPPSIEKQTTLPSVINKERDVAQKSRSFDSKDNSARASKGSTIKYSEIVESMGSEPQTIDTKFNKQPLPLVQLLLHQTLPTSHSSTRTTNEDLQKSLIGKSSEHITALLDTVLEDPVLLRVAIRRCRLDCTEAVHRMAKLKEENKNYVPKKDYLLLAQNYNKLVKSCDQLKQNFRNAKVEYNALTDAVEQVIKERDKYFTLCETYRATFTPRPKWDRCGTIIEGGTVKWKELAIGKTSNELVDLLLNEIIGGNDQNNNVYQFIGLGLDTSVPAFLQTTTNVRNRYFMYRDVAILINDIWKDKLVYDAEQEKIYQKQMMQLVEQEQQHTLQEVTLKTVVNSLLDPVTTNLQQQSPFQKSKLVDFVNIYLKNRFEDEQMQLEWGYNLADGCRRYKYYSNIGLFWAILTGDVDEGVYKYRKDLLSSLKKHLDKRMSMHASVEQERPLLPPLFLSASSIITASTTTSTILENVTQSIVNKQLKQTESVLSKDELRNAFQEFFPLKSEVEIESLVAGSEMDSKMLDSSRINYSKLFDENDEGDGGEFVTLLFKQIDDEKKAYVNDIKQLIQTKNNISMLDFKNAVVYVDPEIADTELTRYTDWVYRHGGESRALPVDEITKRLMNGIIYRHGHKPQMGQDQWRFSPSVNERMKQQQRIKGKKKNDGGPGEKGTETTSMKRDNTSTDKSGVRQPSKLKILTRSKKPVGKTTALEGSQSVISGNKLKVKEDKKDNNKNKQPKKVKIRRRKNKYLSV